MPSDVWHAASTTGMSASCNPCTCTYGDTPTRHCSTAYGGGKHKHKRACLPAACKGWSHRWSCAVGAAPFLRSCSTTCVRPLAAAACSAVAPVVSTADTSSTELAWDVARICTAFCESCSFMAFSRSWKRCIARMVSERRVTRVIREERCCCRAAEAKLGAAAVRALLSI